MAENENAETPAPEAAEQTGGAATAAAPQAEATLTEATQTETPQASVPPEEITYHAVEKDGQVTAIWEMQGRKHVRTIDPRSRQGQEILRLYTAEHAE
jgi:hypothetical protein